MKIGSPPPTMWAESFTPEIDEATLMTLCY